MTLKLRLLASAGLIVSVLFGASEWFNYQRTSAFLDETVRLLQSEAGGGAALARLQAGKAALLTGMAARSAAAAALAIAALMLVMNGLWRRGIVSPAKALLYQINLMGRGAWKERVPVRQNGEMGELTEAFNELGERLTFTVHQFAAASKLSAMALIEQRLERRLGLVKEHINGIASVLAVSREYQQEVPETALRNLELVAKDLAEITANIEQEFSRELRNEAVGDRQKAPALSPASHAPDRPN